MTSVPANLRIKRITLCLGFLFPALILAQVNYALTDFDPDQLTMEVSGQQIEITMTVSSTSDSLDLVRIIAPASDTLSSNTADYSANGGYPSSWTVAVSASRDTVTFTPTPPSTPILPGDVVRFSLTVANVASSAADTIQNWSFEARDHDEDALREFLY